MVVLCHFEIVPTFIENFVGQRIGTLRLFAVVEQQILELLIQLGLEQDVFFVCVRIDKANGRLAALMKGLQLGGSKFKSQVFHTADVNLKRTRFTTAIGSPSGPKLTANY